jgi:hypothetical protein
MFLLTIDADRGESPGSQVGGGAWWPAELPWPASPGGTPMRPLLTLRQDLFVVSTIPAGHCVTVFAPHHEGRHAADLRACALAGPAQLPALPHKASGPPVDGLRVILHADSGSQTAPAGQWPALRLSRRSPTDDEQAEEVAGDVHGLDASKLFGRPHWLQDDIHEHPSQQFVLQLRERDLSRADAAYDGLWRDGSVYLFLCHGLSQPDGRPRRPPGPCGLAFVQFT